MTRSTVERLTDVVGLYLNPPEHALALSVNEKNQIQALVCCHVLRSSVVIGGVRSLLLFL